MSVRLKLISHNITALVVLLLLSVSISFLIFWQMALPYIGTRLAENLGGIAAKYFPAAALLALILAGIGAVWLYAVSAKSVALPLRRLKRASAEIRDGNLDFELAVSGHDEFTELSMNFEQMRLKLKEGIHEKHRAEAERSAMIASICHDLNTPITSILGYSEGILDGVAATPEKALEYMAVIRNKALSLRKLADDLALLSKLEHALITLSAEPVDLGVYIREFSTEYEPSAEITFELPERLICSLDGEKFGRALDNIYQNSIKYKQPGQDLALLRVSAESVKGYIHIKISDKGQGIKAADASRVFDRFYRGDSSRNIAPGSGLGLSIARQIVQLHGGKIWISSNADSGVSVNIVLKTAEEEAS